MGRALGFISLLIVMAVVVYLYMKNTTAIAPGAENGPTSPRGIIDTTGVKNDLIAMAQAEKRHFASEGKYVSLDELKSSGDMSVNPAGRMNFSYDATYSDTDFHITATYHGPEAQNVPKSMSIDPSMSISSEP